MILIVDDDPSVVASLALALKQAGYASKSASNPAEALDQLERHHFELVLQDMNFSRQTSGDEGLELLQKIKSRNPGIPVVLITAWGSIPLAVRGMRNGASDFVTKPWTNQQILQSVRTTIGLAEFKHSNGSDKAISRAALDAVYDFRAVIGSDPGFVRTLDVLGRVSATDASVLITGESGTGKELVAEAIHKNSRRNKAPFVKVNLGGISASLFESEMFGHIKGAFTDAYQNRKGRFEMADGGTIFLDEVGDLDPVSQVKMLRVLQDRTFEALGSSASRSVDVRVVSATNRDLAGLVLRGEFREDLLYRLNLIAVHLPALRDRSGDIPLLANHFLEGLARTYRLEDAGISPAALDWLRSLEWPGNIRQLKQLIERTVLVNGRANLELEDFIRTKEMEGGSVYRESLPNPGSMTLDEVERAMIVRSMQHYCGNISKVADALGMSRAALYRRFEKHGIKP